MRNMERTLRRREWLARLAALGSLGLAGCASAMQAIAPKTADILLLYVKLHLISELFAI